MTAISTHSLEQVVTRLYEDEQINQFSIYDFSYRNHTYQAQLDSGDTRKCMVTSSTLPHRNSTLLYVIDFFFHPQQTVRLLVAKHHLNHTWQIKVLSAAPFTESMKSQFAFLRDIPLYQSAVKDTDAHQVQPQFIPIPGFVSKLITISDKEMTLKIKVLNGEFREFREFTMKFYQWRQLLLSKVISDKRQYDAIVLALVEQLERISDDEYGDCKHTLKIQLMHKLPRINPKIQALYNHIKSLPDLPCCDAPDDEICMLSCEAINELPHVIEIKSGNMWKRVSKDMILGWLEADGTTHPDTRETLTEGHFRALTPTQAQVEANS